jgi:phosphate transport system permease protein
VVIGTPIGVLAGTYLAEYGRHDRLSSVVRFINDILLSAPSIVIGLFIYEVMVAPMGHFSGYAGGVALAVIVIPVVVRTTEDMLTLVPNSLREAATSIGLPRSLSITRICYRAARAGMVTGVLLAVARISGETAPLLFTSLNNQFWSNNLNARSSLPVVIFQFALSPYKDWQALAWTGALIITLAVLALSITARALVRSENSHEPTLHPSPFPPLPTPPSIGRPRRKDHDPRSQFLLRRRSSAEIDQPFALREQGHRLHRSVGLRQIDFAARPQPHVRPLSAPARDRRSHVRRRQYPVAQAGPQSAARPHRHGVPEADAVSDVDLREHRLRHQAL